MLTKRTHRLTPTSYTLDSIDDGQLTAEKPWLTNPIVHYLRHLEKYISHRRDDDTALSEGSTN